MKRASWLAFALAFALTQPARADDIEKARKVFAEGVRLYRSGDWEGARRLFREADAEHHSPVIVYNVGLAEERLGHTQAAVDLYERYISEAGDSGEFASAAASAIAQLKARSTRLRIDTKPSGGRVFVDGTPLAEKAPVQLLVPAGHHVVVAQVDTWREEREVEARGAGDTMIVAFEAPASAAPPVVASPETAPSPSPLPVPPNGPDLARPSPPPDSDASRPDGITWGAEFAVVPLYLFGVVNPTADNQRPGTSILAGAVLELGYAVTDHFEFMGRGFLGIGPDAKPSYGYLGGPGLAYLVGSSLWVGATFIGGQIETKAHDARYGTDIVFGTMLEANLVVVKKSHGEWLAGIQPSLLLTQIHQDNTALFFPLTFGYRAY